MCVYCVISTNYLAINMSKTNAEIEIGIIKFTLPA